jgi:cytochrome c556
VVENAAIALAESADLILKPGRVCSNGKPAPVTRADYQKFAAGLRAAGRAALEAAKTKNQDKVIEVTDAVAGACADCHEVYRDKGPAGSPERCTPATP